MGHESYRGWLCIPYLTPAGPVAVKFRRLDDGEPKYLGPVGQQVHLYNVGALHRAGEAIAVCEGEIDALVLDGLVGIPAVGVAGVNSWKDHFTRTLEGFGTVMVFADNDVKSDGRNPGRELANRLVEELDQAVFVELPKGKDVNDVWKESGAEPLRDLARGAGWNE